MVKTNKLFKQLIEKHNIVENDSKFICNVCNKILTINKQITNIKSHINSIKHRKNVVLYKNINNKNISIKNNSEFLYDLCESFIQTGIPLNVINEKPIINLFKKHFGKILPDESNMRKNYLDKVYNNTLNKIKQKINDKNLYFVIDETRDNHK